MFEIDVLVSCASKRDRPQLTGRCGAAFVDPGPQRGFCLSSSAELVNLTGLMGGEFVLFASSAEIPFAHFSVAIVAEYLFHIMLLGSISSPFLC